MPNARRLSAAFLLAPLFVACGDGEAGSREGTEWTATHDTIGDTIVVTTTAGSTWKSDATLEPEMRIGQVTGADEYLLGRVNGFDVDSAGNIYLYDDQVPVFRKYAPDGTYLATFGREGAGPGEYRQSDGGIAVLPDGRVLLRDPGNARINVYTPEGEPLDSWRIRGGRFVSSRLVVDSVGTVYTQVFGDRRGMAIVGPGENHDTIDYPDRGHDTRTVTATREGSRQTWTVPFAATERWTFSPQGYFVGGVSTRYAVDVVRPDQPVLRIRRITPAVPVSAGERAYQEERVATAMRRLDPGWQWPGADIPDVKPPFTNAFAGRDGRIWVQLSRPGEEVTVEPADGDRAGAGDDAPTTVWRELVVFDVFEPDGRYLGQVHAPDGFETYPVPIFDGDNVWAVVTDDMGVQYLVRFAVAFPSEGS